VAVSEFLPDLFCRTRSPSSSAQGGRGKLDVPPLGDCTGAIPEAKAQLPDGRRSARNRPEPVGRAAVKVVINRWCALVPKPLSEGLSDRPRSSPPARPRRRIR
jgi:hypothetical protein